MLGAPPPSVTLLDGNLDGGDATVPPAVVDGGSLPLATKRMEDQRRWAKLEKQISAKNAPLPELA